MDKRQFKQSFRIGIYVVLILSNHILYYKLIGGSVNVDAVIYRIEKYSADFFLNNLVLVLYSVNIIGKTDVQVLVRNKNICFQALDVSLKGKGNDAVRFFCNVLEIVVFILRFFPTRDHKGEICNSKRSGDYFR